MEDSIQKISLLTNKNEITFLRGDNVGRKYFVKTANSKKSCRNMIKTESSIVIKLGIFYCYKAI